jgi:hypothetical protein
MTELHMVDACAQFRKLTGEEPLLFIVYRVWFAAHHQRFCPDMHLESTDWILTCVFIKHMHFER